MLNPRFQHSKKYEICLDEVARGPLFGRVYAAAVVFDPTTTDFTKKEFQQIKDSKKFYSRKKRKEVYEFIINNCLAYSVQYVDVETIDKINILQSVYNAMHSCIKDIFANLRRPDPENIYDNAFLLIDGDRFRPFCVFTGEEWKEIPHETVEKGDATYMGIAAASILAKVEHDEYIIDLCKTYPELETRYKIHKNMGYGTKEHLEGIRDYGICQFHRKTFGLCKTQTINNVVIQESDTELSKKKE